jgi:hypothetical protein
MLPVDDELPWDGMGKTVGQRFHEERERWEAETGYKLAGTVPGFSKQVVRAIEEDLGGIRKGARIEMLLYAGIDVLYVLNGTRTLTKVERTIRDAYRLADPEQRAGILGAAIALPRTGDLNQLSLQKSKAYESHAPPHALLPRDLLSHVGHTGKNVTYVTSAEIRRF